MKTVIADAPFYKNSGGGLTCSGGEPLIQSDFLLRILAEAKEKGIHTALDTAGNINYKTLEGALPLLDLVLYDLKCMDDARHIDSTGVSNELILDNLDRVASSGVIDVWIRVPVVPGFNDDMRNMEDSACFLRGKKGVKRVELLAYHSLGEGKYESLGVSKEKKGPNTPAKSVLTALSQPFRELGVEVLCR